MSRGKKYNNIQTVDNQISFETLYGEDPLVKKYIESDIKIDSIQYFCGYFNGADAFGAYHTAIPFVNGEIIDKVVFKTKEQMFNFCKKLKISDHRPYRSGIS